ncbi:MAG: DUF6786 family protein [Thermofilaceae archaeon]
MEGSELARLVSHYSATVTLKRGKAEVLVLERGGRILTLQYDGLNLLWVNPNIKLVLETGGWNTGGLRLWISPERSFFYEKPAEFGGWFCPSGIDPAEFRLVKAGQESATVEGFFDVQDRVTGWRLCAYTRRDFYLLSENRLLIREALLADYPGDFNPWALAQVPPEGTVIVPVKKGASPVHYFGPIPEDRLKIAEDHVAFKIDAKRVCKLGIRPEDLPVEGSALIAYVSQSDGKWTLIMKKTHDTPRTQAECLDSARFDPKGPKGSVQSYNSGPEGGAEQFGEIELQFKPAIDIGRRKIAIAEYEVIFTAGTAGEVLELLKKETGIKKPQLF